MSLRDKLPPEEVAAARQRYAITRAAHIIREMRQRQHSSEMIARALDAKGLLNKYPRLDAPDAHMRNPYRIEREAGESGADT